MVLIARCARNGEMNQSQELGRPPSSRTEVVGLLASAEVRNED